MGGLQSLARFRHASQGHWEGDCGLCQVGTWKPRAGEASTVAAAAARRLEWGPFSARTWS